MFSKTWLKASAERAVKTFAQAALAMLVGDRIGVLNVNWGDVGSVAALAAIVSVLTSIASSPFGPVGSPSIVEDPKAIDAP
jgi:hypothetical protein